MRRPAAVTAMVFGLAALSGCTGHHSNAAPLPAVPATPEQAAHQVGRQMLDAVVVPRTAQLYHGQLPAILTSAAAGVPAVANMVDEYRTWAVPIPSKSLRNFAFTRGNGYSGVAGASGYSAGRDGRAWIGSAAYTKLPLNVALAQLDIGITDDGHGGSVIRADALTFWTPPKTAAELVPAGDHVAVLTQMAADAPPDVRRRVVVSDSERFAALAAAVDGLRLAPIVRFGECGLLNVQVPGLGLYGRGTMILEVGFSHDRQAKPDLIVWTPTCRGVGVRAHGKLQPTLQDDGTFLRTVRAVLTGSAS